LESCTNIVLKIRKSAGHQQEQRRCDGLQDEPAGHPFAFLLAALVFIVDGSLGILKISFKRFLHISILKNTLTPLHDHVRKRMGWSDEQVVARWLILQAVASALLLLMTR
jgi:phospho-N-acetylmuramoyl-pentapeptide-transferase